MNKIDLENLELKTFTEQDALDYCQINNINSDNIIIIYLNNNELTDISGIKLFKNLKRLCLYNNELTDISVIQYSTNLEFLALNRNKIEDISVIKNLNKLNYLNISNNKIVNISVVKNLNSFETLSIVNLELESDQIKYIKSLNNLKQLFCEKGFKDMTVLNQLNKNIEIYE